MLSEDLFEIFQICIILFLIALFVSFCLSNLFGLIDNKIKEIENKDLKNFSIILNTFIQLCITTIIYFYVEKNLHHIRLWKTLLKNVKKKLYIADLETFKYATHIVLIIVLIEMNYSLKYNLYYIKDLLKIGR